MTDVKVWLFNGKETEKPMYNMSKKAKKKANQYISGKSCQANQDGECKSRKMTKEELKKYLNNK